ncbi:MAG: RNA polymerase sigma factor [Candidatus Zixiibacteriota bacterium]
MIEMNKLVDRAKSGDERAEEELFCILRARFMSIAKRRVWNKETAEDVVQQACETVVMKYKNEEYRSGFEAWAYCVLRMKIGNYLQSKRVRQERTCPDLNSERVPDQPVLEMNPDLELSLIDCLRKILRSIPRYARVLSLSYQGYESEEICSRMHITRNSLYSLLSRSRATLNKCLDTGVV